MREEHAARIAGRIVEALRGADAAARLSAVRAQVAELCGAFPVPALAAGSRP